MERSTMIPGNITPIKKLAPHVYSPGQGSRSTSSPFKNHHQVMYSTPPQSKFFTVRNPFDAALVNRLHLPAVSSPTIFQKHPTPKGDHFQWTIDELALLNPIAIDEHAHVEHPEDPEFERAAQMNIDKYFSDTKHIVPSPWDDDRVGKPVIRSSTSTPVRKIVTDSCDNTSQTVLSFPPILPPEVEAILKPYFQFHEDQQKSSMNESLCRRLFNFSESSHEEELDASIVDLPPGPSESPIMENAGLSNTSFEHRNFLDSPTISPVHRQSTSTPSPQSLKSTPPVEEPPLSPIVSEETQRSAMETSSTSRRSSKRLHFSTSMSVDCVPDSENLPEDQSLIGTSLLLPLGANPEEETFSSVNWDMENRSISNRSKPELEDNLLQPWKNTSLMDISNSSPGALRRRTRQRFRKQLSEQFDEHNKENIPSKILLRRCLSESIRSRNCEMEDDSLVRDRSLLGGDNTISFDETSTQDTGYNSNIGEGVSHNGTANLISAMLSNTNVASWPHNGNIFESTPRFN